MNYENTNLPIINSVDLIYGNSGTPVMLCNDQIDLIWGNKKSQEMFESISFDLLFTNIDVCNIRKCIEENISTKIYICNMAFIGYCVNVLPISSEHFSGAIMIIDPEQDENVQTIADRIDNVVSMIFSNFRLPIHLINNTVYEINHNIVHEQNLNTNKLQKSLNFIENNAHKLFRSCNNMSDMIRFSGNAYHINYSMVRIKEYMDSLIDSCILYINRLNIPVDYTFSADPSAPSWMSIDCDKIGLAISNILLNSCQYTKSNNRIKIIVNVTMQNLTISIQDKGIGISKDDLDDIFRPYSKTKISDSINTGMGIGLTLVKYIVEKHDGTVNIDSNQGEGTTVTITIPIKLDNKNPVIRINNMSAFNDKFSTTAIQFSVLDFDKK